jgi:hypothetical protein
MDIRFVKLAAGRYEVRRGSATLGIVARYGRGGKGWWKPEGWRVRCDTRGEAAGFLTSVYFIAQKEAFAGGAR